MTRAAATPKPAGSSATTPTNGLAPEGPAAPPSGHGRPSATRRSRVPHRGCRLHSLAVGRVEAGDLARWDAARELTDRRSAARRRHGDQRGRALFVDRPGSSPFSASSASAPRGCTPPRRTTSGSYPSSVVATCWEGRLGRSLPGLHTARHRWATTAEVRNGRRSSATIPAGSVRRRRQRRGRPRGRKQTRTASAIIRSVTAGFGRHTGSAIGPTGPGARRRRAPARRLGPVLASEGAEPPAADRVPGQPNGPGMPAACTARALARLVRAATRRTGSGRSIGSPAGRSIIPRICRPAPAGPSASWAGSSPGRLDARPSARSVFTPVSLEVQTEASTSPADPAAGTAAHPGLPRATGRRPRSRTPPRRRPRSIPPLADPGAGVRCLLPSW